MSIFSLSLYDRQFNQSSSLSPSFDCLIRLWAALQTGCQLHYHTADSVLTSGCSFISQHIRIIICIVLAILGRCINSKKISTGKRCMWICISGQQVDNLGMLSSGIGTSWGGWRFGQRWHQLWSWLSASVRWRCACFFVSPLGLLILCSAILARKASGRVVLTKHSRVSFHCSLHTFMPWKYNTPVLLFLDLGAWFCDQELHFPYCGLQKPSFGHFRHIQGQAHVRLFHLYPTSLRCNSSRHVDIPEGISCCL